MRYTLLSILTSLLTSQLTLQAQTATRIIRPPDIVDARNGAPKITIPDKIVIPYKRYPGTSNLPQEPQQDKARIFIFDYTHLPPSTPTINLKGMTWKIIIFTNCPIPVKDLQNVEWPPKTPPNPNALITQTSDGPYIQSLIINQNQVITIPPHSKLTKDQIDQFTNTLVTNIATTRGTYNLGSHYDPKVALNTILDTRTRGATALDIPGKSILYIDRSNPKTQIQPHQMDLAKIIIIDCKDNPRLNTTETGKLIGEYNDKIIIYTNCHVPMRYIGLSGSVPPNPNNLNIPTPTTDEIEEATTPTVSSPVNRTLQN